MASYQITVPGRPVPKVRMTQRSKWSPRAQASLQYQERVAWSAKAQTRHAQLFGPVRLSVWVYLRPTQRGLLPENRPDLSNVIKAIEDGLQYGGIVKNDRQIIEYGMSGYRLDYNERVEITLEEISDEGVAV
ncbi:MAG: RusA family crossover junction endodeoxyribonuclease [Firmicutes bacterium]|nr:RusA family crossover junction endodeoxyribonuclease [Bacillota bacterium]